MNMNEVNKNPDLCEFKNVSVIVTDLSVFSIIQYNQLKKERKLAFPSVKVDKVYLKRAIVNSYSTCGYSKRNVLTRAMVLNPILIFILLRNKTEMDSIQNLLESYLHILAMENMTYRELSDLRYTITVVAQSLQHATFVKDVYNWTLVLKKSQKPANLLLSEPQIEVQALWSLGTGEITTAIQDATDVFQECIPSFVERDTAYSTIKNVSASADDLTSAIKQHLPSQEERARYEKQFETLNHHIHKITSYGKDISTLGLMIDGLNDQIRRSHATVTHSLDNVFTLVDKTSDVLLCAAVTWACARYTDKKSKVNLAYLLMTGGALMYYGKSNESKIFLVGSGLFATLTAISSLDLSEDVEMQSFSLSGISDIFTGFSAFMTSIKWDSLPKKILDIIRVSYELPKFIMQVFELLKGWINIVWTKFFKTPLFTPSGDVSEDYAERLRIVYTKFKSDNLDRSFAESQEVTELLKLTKQYLNECRNMGDRKVLDTNYRVLVAIDQELSDMRYTLGGTRQEPVTIMFHGIPGTKKTDWAKKVSHALASAHGFTDRPELQVYHKPQGDYWSMYRNQLITFFDDFGQVRDSVGDPREKADLISMYNTVPFPLNMNENDDKGKYFFTSTYVVMTANEGWSDSPSLISEGALKRRLDVSVTVLKKSKSNKSINETGVEIIIPEDYEFETEIKGKNYGKLTFQGLIDQCVVNHRIKEKHYSLHQRVAKTMMNSSVITTNVQVDLDKAMKEVEAEFELKMKEMSLLNTDNKSGGVEKQGNEFGINLPEQEADLNMSDLMDDLEKVSSIHRTTSKLNSILGFTPYLAPKVEVIRSLDGAEYSCEAYLDFSEELYNDYAFIMRKHYNQYEPTHVKPEYAVLTHHFGLNRVKLYLWDKNIAEDIFGDVRIQPIKDLYRKMASSERGYFVTEESIKMSIWLGDRETFYRCHSDLSNSLLESVKIFTFRENILLSDWKATYRRVKLKLIGFSDSLWDSTVKLVSSLEDKIAASIGDALGLGIFQKSNIKSFLRLGVGLVSVVTTLTPLIVMLVSYLTGEKPEKQTYFQHHDRKESSKKSSLKDLIKTRGAETQGSGLIPMTSKIEENACVISIVQGKDKHILGKAMYLNTKALIMPLHYYADFTVLKEFVVEIEDKNGKVALTATELFMAPNYIIEENDLEFIVIASDKFKKCRKDLKDSFISQEQLAKMASSFRIAMHPFTEKTVMVAEAEVTNVTAHGITARKLVKYGIDTGKGDCGSFIYVLNPVLGTNIICGIHQFGYPKGSANKIGMAFVLTKEDILEALAALELDTPVEKQSIPLHAEFTHHPYSISKIIPSAISKHPLMEVTTAPAMLIPRDGIDPLANGLAKYKKYDMDVDYGILNHAKADLSSRLCAFSHSVRYGSTVPYDLCMFGDPYEQYMNALPTSTSAGYPLKFTYKKIKSVMKEEGPEGATFKNVVSELEGYEKSYRSGNRPLFIYTVNLKDTTVSKEKAKLGKTRVYFGTPMHLCLMMKKYFGEFILFLQRDCVSKGTAMTVNPHSPDWRSIALLLSQFTSNYAQALVQDFDYSHFDASNNPVIMDVIVEIINTWYTHHGIGHDNDMRIHLLEEIKNFRYICGSNIITMDTSLPSGVYLTLLINCLSNKLIMRYAYYATLGLDVSYDKRVFDIVMGDDNVVSVDPSISEKFTPLHIANQAAKLGFAITLGDKTEVKGGWSDLSSVTFLKRKFSISEHGVVRAPLDLNPLWNCLAWTKAGELYEEITRTNIEFFYRELSQHDSSIWDSEIGRLRNILKDYRRFNSIPDNMYQPQSFWDRLVRSTDCMTEHVL